MTDRDRVLRRHRDAKIAAQQFENATTAADLQDSWERWTISWRIAVDMLEGYGRRNKAIDGPLAALISERSSNAALSYVWQSGNAERHNPQGSAEASGGLAINAADRSQPLIIDSLIVRNGQIVQLTGQNVALDFDVGSLTLQPIHVRGGKSVMPPANTAPIDLLRSGSAYLARLHSLVAPNF